MSLYIAHPLDDFMESINLYTFNEGKELVSSITVSYTHLTLPTSDLV